MPPPPRHCPRPMPPPNAQKLNEFPLLRFQVEINPVKDKILFYHHECSLFYNTQKIQPFFHA